MPGKGDYGAGGAQGQYFPGDNEYRAWDEGWRYRYSGTAAARPIEDNPYINQGRPAEKDAWDAGWNEASANSGGAQRMPATTGAPP